MVTWRRDRAGKEDDSHREVNRVRLTIKPGLGRYTVLLLGIGVAGVAIGWFNPGLTQDINTIRPAGSR
jgi:hypothetical protein